MKLPRSEGSFYSADRIIRVEEYREADMLIVALTFTLFLIIALLPLTLADKKLISAKDLDEMGIRLEHSGSQRA